MQRMKSAIMTAAAHPWKQSSRLLFGLATKKNVFGDENVHPFLESNNLFHPWSKSPVKALRERADFIKRHALCPVTRKQITFDCPKCGIPTHHSEEAWQSDHHFHEHVVAKLREVNEDEHDIRSGRRLNEFLLPDDQSVDAALNFESWDALFYTRGFDAVNSLRARRHVSKLLTYPVTIASVLHERSPYMINHRLTVEGLKSLAALRYTLHPPVVDHSDAQHLKESRPVRIFVVGARAESLLPRHVWLQLSYMFPDVAFDIHFIGPEAVYGQPSKPAADIAEAENFAPTLTFFTHTENFHDLHNSRTFAPYDPYQDVFFLFSPGLGYPPSSPQWEPSLSGLLETKCGIFATGYTYEDMTRDIEWLERTCKKEYDLLLEPGENHFASRKYDMSDSDPMDVIQANWGIFGFRGKRYETILSDEGEV